MDTQIDINRWLTLAEEEICEADGALSVLGGERSDDSLELYGLANLDADGVAEYLKDLVAKLQMAAACLTILADHADLTELAESLKSSSNGTTGEGA